MPLDEYLFSRVSNYFKKNKSKVSEDRIVYLDDLKERLTLIARAVSGDAIHIYHAEREGGYKNNAFFLPTSFSSFPTKTQNELFYKYRVLYLCTQRSLGYNWQQDEDQNLFASQQKSLEKAPDILKSLFEEFPMMLEHHQSFIIQIKQAAPPDHPVDFTWLYGKWMHNAAEDPEKTELTNFDHFTQKKEKEQELTVLKMRAVEEIISIEIDKKQQEDYVMTHNFEKVDTAEEIDDVWRDFDGDDELKDHEDALKELNMKFTIRVDDTAHSVYHADFIENTTVSESSEMKKDSFHFSYDEWDYAKNQYKNQYCKVYPIATTAPDPGYYTETIQKYATTLISLRKMLTNINNKLQSVRRQPQGNEFDIDALTDLYVDVHSGHTPTENIYISDRKIEKDISMLLLLDVSLSSDGYADGNRIIDVEKQVSILFGEILNEYNVDFSIQAFYSKTRNYSTFQTLKGFDDSWDKCKYMIGSVQPEGYTRIGAALRHSGALLEKRNTKNKWVILLSDGKPNDYDKYEGKYGINDVKQALHELHEKNIHGYALAIEAQAKYYLPQMFGQNHYQILTTPIELLQSMVKLYEKIKHQS